MQKTLLLVCLIGATLSSVECSFSLKNIFQRKTTTEEPTTLPTTTTAATTERTKSIFLYNNVPQFDVGCQIDFQCKKRLKDAESPKPCLKYCVHFVTCPNAAKTRGKPDECFEFDEAFVVRDDAANKKSDTLSAAPVAMIDFPCQPGYLPDSRGRCREVW